MPFNDGLIKFRHVVCLLEIVRQGSISRAAEALSVAQPALSRTLAELEDIVGARLVVRTRRGCSLTPEGESFYRHAAPGAAQLRQAFASARPGSQERGAIGIGALPEAVSLIAKVLPMLRERLPDIAPRVLQGTNAAHLASLRHGDIAFVIGRIAATSLLTGLAFEHLYAEPVCCVARSGHRRLGQPPLPAAELAGERLVLHPSSTIIRAEIDRFLFAQGVVEFADPVETDSMSLARRLALEDDRLWIAPLSVVARDLRDGRLVPVRVGNWNIAASVGITTDPKRNPTRAEATLIDLLRQSADAVSRADGAALAASGG